VNTSSEEPRRPDGPTTHGDSFADVELRFFEAEQGADGTARYPVELRLNGEQEYPRGYLRPPEGLLPWVPGPDSKADGERLYECLFTDGELSKAWADIMARCPRRRIRLRIDAAAAVLHSIPWELMRERPVGGVAVVLAATDASPFSRYLAGPWQPGSPILQRPIKVLVAISNPATMPAGLQSVDVETEIAALRAATKGSDLQLTLLPPPCTLETIEEELRKGYHVLHFIGHGRFDPKAQTTQLVIENPEQPNRPFVNGDAVAEMLKRQLQGKDAYDDRLRLVFLCSCETATTSSADAFRGLAPLLVQGGVPAVIAMQDLVPVDTARSFASTFYRKLLEHGRIDLASNQARSSVLARSLPGSHIPVLFMRLRSGELFGKRGQVSAASNPANFWPFLVQYVLKGRCVPFIGPRAAASMLPSASALAEQLADKYDYPLPDRRNLARVAQFCATSGPDLLREDYLGLLTDGARRRLMALGLQPEPAQEGLFAQGGLLAVTRALRWAGNVLASHESEIHHLLAELALPLYITTNHDGFMVEALNRPEAVQARNGHMARQVGPRWERTEAGNERYALMPPPSKEQPVVFHLNGHDGDSSQAERLVLSEDDHLEHLVRLARDQEFILPTNLLGEVAKKRFLFIGYDFEDWEFRVLLRGLIKSIAQTRDPRQCHIGVQLEGEQIEKRKGIHEYLQSYLNEFNISIYWGTSQQFVVDLHARWQAVGGK
jgi:hypothetical protein